MNEMFPGLRLVAPLAGSDGTTDVWRGEWQGEEVAVKRLLVDAGTRPDLHHRFQQEGELLSALGGRRHLVACRRVIDTPPAIVLELGVGGDLATWIEREGPSTPRTALAVLRQAAAAVSWLHTNHVLHRDLKPSNVVLMGDGTWRLVDLGVAAVGNPPRGLPAGWVEEEIGTPDWRAPELGLDPARATAATDVYGLAGIALALLTGASPAQRASARVDVGSRLAPLFARAFASDAGDRQPSVASLMREVELALSA